MFRNFDAPILDLDGSQIRVGATLETMVAAFNEFFPKLPPALQSEINAIVEKHAGAQLTLRTVCLSALMTLYEDERNLDDETRMRRMELARRIYAGGTQDIEPKDRDMIKPLLKKKFFSILIPVVAAELLEKDCIAPLKMVP